MMSCKKLWSDRFSNLPDEVAYHILSFLSFKELARVAIVSKRCREFYLSVPLVNLDAKTKQKRAELMSFWDRYMFHRGDKKMQRFYIEWRFSTSDTANKVCDEHFRIITWIYNAVRCKGEELDLNFTVCGGMTTFALPSCLYQSQYLKSLILKCSNEMTIEAPSVSHSCNLRYLQLSSVKIVDERVCRWISCSCKCIKELQLILVKGLQNITIKSSSLESFKLVSGAGMDLVHLSISGGKLENFDLNWSFGTSPDYHSLNIDAPNLKALQWEGQVLNSQNLGKLMNLRSAVIFIQPKVNDDISEVFGSICRAKILFLHENTVKVYGHYPLLLVNTSYFAI